MRLVTVAAETVPSSSRLLLSLAGTPEEVREVQRLRYKVFVDLMGVSVLANPEGLDRDEFDEFGDHLIVRDRNTLEVVGTYRILSPHGARQIGRFYSEQEFNLGRLRNLRAGMAEAGRACVHPEYRSGAVITLLWAGLAAYMKKKQCKYLIGCASVSLADGGHNLAALYRSIEPANRAPAEYRVTPHLPFPIATRETACEPQVPPLIRGYLKSGAWVCGEPAWDPDFHCADLFMLLPMDKLDERFARHYFRQPAAA